MNCAARIRDPERRRAFLERVPENARIVELAAQARISERTQPRGDDLP
jgi:hypothetical protein